MKTAVLVLDNLRSVENTASIFRTAEGLGVRKIYLVGTTPAPVDRFGRMRRDFIKVSLGAERLEYEQVENIEGLLEGLKDQGFELISLEQTNDSVDIRGFKTGKQFALIVGNEVGGVSMEALELSDKVVEITMRGEKESLNVSVATGIALFHII